MFLVKLYKFNKVLFGLFSVFILVFIVINYKWGTVATPVLQYGMYSSVFSMKDTQTVYLVKADGQSINNAGISLTNRDILQIYPDTYARQAQVNKDVYAIMERYFGYAGLSSLMHYDRFHNTISDNLFISWYKTQAEKITGKKINNLVIYQQHFTWQGSRLQPIDTAIKLYSLGN